MLSPSLLILSNDIADMLLLMFCDSGANFSAPSWGGQMTGLTNR